MAFDDADRVARRRDSVTRGYAAVEEQPTLLCRAPFLRELTLCRLAIPFDRVERALRQHERVWVIGRPSGVRPTITRVDDLEARVHRAHPERWRYKVPR